jgi:hypothetical protein
MHLLEEMIKEFEDAEETWAKLERVYPIFNSSLKDEAMKLTKKVARSFQCSSMPLALGLRKYYLIFLTIMLKYPTLFEIAVGCNAEGPEWDAIISSIAKFGDDRVVAGDYKNYDQKMSAQLMSATFNIYIKMAEAIGYSERDLNIMRGIATDTIFPIINLNGDILQLYGSMTSGNTLTTLGNCMNNSLLHRIAYYGLAEHYGLEVPPFHEVCSLVTYGDDCADSVRHGYDWFNHTNRQWFFAKYDIVYTMAIKDQDSVPFINIKDLSFLKRTPRFEDDVGVYLAPLEEKSIIKSLQFVTKSVLTPEQAAAVNIDNSICAYFLHGREIFDDRVPKLRRILEKHNLVPFSRCYDWSYEYILNLWRSKYKTGESPITIHPDLPGLQTKEWDLDTDYDTKYSMALSRLVDACLDQAEVPDTSPLLRGGDAGPHAPVDLNVQHGIESEIYCVTDNIIDTIQYLFESWRTMYCPREDETAIEDELWDSYRDYVWGRPFYPIESIAEDHDEYYDMWIQSGVANRSNAVTGGTTNSNLVRFNDIDMEVTNTVTSTLDGTRYKSTKSDDDLNNFFSRPVRIQTITVSVATPVSTSFNPWDDFCSNARIINRLNNYTNLRGKLHVKFMINGNQFYYGKLIASYLPLGPNDNLEEAHVAGDDGDITLATQRPHIFIDPCNSKGGELLLPFFWYKDSLNIPDGEWALMGTIYVESINTLLAANGSTTDLNITVFAWMEDVQVDSPTIVDSVNLVAQSGEYDSKGLVSRPMTAMATFVNGVGKMIPTIAPYTTAASATMNMGASIAKLFGYSRPPDIENAKRMAPKPMANFANYDQMDNTTKLCLDTKQELTADPRVFGYGPEDELSIASLATRQNYINTVQWGVTDTPLTKLQSVRVSPHHVVSKSSGSKCYTSYSLPSLDFFYWQGTMKLKVEVVASNFHKGRLAIVYDPQVNPSTYEPTVQHSYVMDIADEKEMTITIPWSQSYGWGIRPESFGSPLVIGPGFGTTITKNDTDNGIISIFVLNELTTPAASTQDIYINLYVSFEDDLCFYGPQGTYNTMTFANLSTQAGMMDSDCADDCQMPDGDTTDMVVGNDQSKDNHEMLVYGGENIRTMRALFKRPVKYIDIPIVTESGSFSAFYGCPTRPLPRGYNVTTFGDDFHRVFNSVSTILFHAYAGYKGGIRYKTYTSSDDILITMAPTNTSNPFSQFASALSYTYLQGANNTAFVTAQNDLAGFTSGLTNRCNEMQHTHGTQCVEAEFPYFYPYRFSPTRDINFEWVSSLNPLRRIRQTSFVGNNGGNNQFASQMVSVGEDFQLVFFTGLPPVFDVSNPTPP